MPPEPPQPAVAPVRVAVAPDVEAQAAEPVAVAPVALRSRQFLVQPLLLRLAEGAPLAAQLGVVDAVALPLLLPLQQ